jgi:polyhydroxybutyrate depolymerase
VTPVARGGLALVLALSAACSSATDDAAPSSTVTTTTTSAPTTTTTGETGSIDLGPAGRPAQLVAPDEVTAPAPLLVFLHGFGSNAAGHDAYLGVTDEARSRGLYVLLAEGTAGPLGRQFWDATSACCNFTGTPVDDVAYLGNLIDEAIETRPIDPDRVYVFGHSNGGFMAYRLACDLAGDIAAVAALAGADQLEDADCRPSEPVSVLHLHGTEDEVVRFDGGPSIRPFGDEEIGPDDERAYPSAADTVARWVERDGCDAAPGEGAALDLDRSVEGTETSVAIYEGCDGGATIQMNTIRGGGHIPDLPHEVVGSEVLDWLLAQAR